ncbi:zinc finger, CCHC-type containing protein [Tanacetum coccineum]
MLFAEQWGKIIILEDCSARQFNRSAGKECILTEHLEFIIATMQIPIENEIITVRISEVEGEIDTLFTGYDDDEYSSADENNEDDGGEDFRDGVKVSVMDFGVQDDSTSSVGCFVNDKTSAPPNSFPAVKVTDTPCNFNEVCSNVERKGLIFCQKGADLFNDFIASSGLFDLPLCGMRYTHLHQKAKTRWALEGDENSGFFHGIINSNRNRSHINGLNIHGSWTTNPTTLKSHIFQVYISKFKEDVISRPTFSSDHFKKLFSDDLLILDYPISDQEIKDTIWDCRSEKAPGPDGFTFKFYKSQWDTIAPDVIAYIREFENTSFLLRGCNSYFIALVPKVEDSLVINNFRPISLISSQYTILAKILANRLAMVIPSVVSEAQTDFIKVLANGSPTLELKIERGLTQGNPLSPLLFILAIEALNVVIIEAKNRSLFRGAEVGKDKINVSYFQLANDALILGEWFYNESDSLWGRVIRSIHGPQGGLLDTSIIRSKSGPWYNIAKLRDDLQLRGIDDEDYSKPSHDGYKNTIELPVGNNVVPLRFDTIRLVQNGCSFHELRFEDPNQHLKDFLKLVDSLGLDGENRERTCLRLFQFSLRDQASNWLERLLARSITTWEDLTTRFLAQFFPPGRTAKLHNDILMFQQHQGESLSKIWTRFKDLL